MEFGLFIMPSHPPERNLRAGHEWDLQMIRWADEYGLLEVWTGSTTPKYGNQTQRPKS